MIGIYLGFVPNFNPSKNQLVDLRNGTETYDIRVFYVSNFNPSKKSIGRLAKWNRN